MEDERNYTQEEFDEAIEDADFEAALQSDPFLDEFEEMKDLRNEVFAGYQQYLNAVMSAYKNYKVYTGAQATDKTKEENHGSKI